TDRRDDHPPAPHRRGVAGSPRADAARARGRAARPARDAPTGPSQASGRRRPCSSLSKAVVSRLLFSLKHFKLKGDIRCTFPIPLSKNAATRGRMIYIILGGFYAS